MCGHFTGMPSQASLLPHLPGPTSTYCRSSAVNWAFSFSISRAISGLFCALNPLVFTYTTSHVCHDAVAQHHFRTQEAGLIGDYRQILVNRLLVVNDGTYLQEVEAGGSGIKIHGELNLHWASHFATPNFKQPRNRFCQRILVVLEYICE